MLLCKKMLYIENAEGGGEQFQGLFFWTSTIEIKGMDGQSLRMLL